MTVETYLRQGRRRLETLLLDPNLRRWAKALFWAGGGFLLSGARVGQAPQPLAAGFIGVLPGWRGVVMALGAAAGYPFFWGSQGGRGLVWTAAGSLLSLLLGKKAAARDQPLMLPVLTAVLVAVTEGAFWLLLGRPDPAVVSLLRVGLAFFAGALFYQATRCRDPMTDWLIVGLVALALGPVALPGNIGLGYVAGGLLAVGGPFPAAVFCGLGLDLAQTDRLPMAAVLALAYTARMVPGLPRRFRWLAPAGAWALTAAAWGPPVSWAPLPGLLAGGGLGLLLPPAPQPAQRRGSTGGAQVRLELGAQVLLRLGRLYRQLEVPEPDPVSFLERARDRACSRCSKADRCTWRNRLTPALLANPLDGNCPRPGRLIPELQRAREGLLGLKRELRHRREYTGALLEQIQFLAGYLQSLADALPRRQEQPQAVFRVEVSARSRGRQQVNGDQCLAFPGPGCRYYVLLCDGMGTGPAAALESRTAGKLLRQMLTAGFPPEHSLETVNSLLTLRGCPGGVSLDLAQLRLDTGQARLYKWGAAPSWVLRRNGRERIGTASPPPGLWIGKARQKVWKLSLSAGEVLMLLSDGVDGEDALSRFSFTPDAPPGEIAAEILEKGCDHPDDDATAAVIRLRPTGAL